MDIWLLLHDPLIVTSPLSSQTSIHFVRQPYEILFEDTTGDVSCGSGVTWDGIETRWEWGKWEQQVVSPQVRVVHAGDASNDLNTWSGIKVIPGPLNVIECRELGLSFRRCVDVENAIKVEQ